MTIPIQYPPLLPPHLESFHLRFCCPRLYNCIPIVFRHDVQVALHFPLDKLTQDPDDVDD
jgi:hypothetical protein